MIDNANQRQMFDCMDEFDMDVELGVVVYQCVKGVFRCAGFWSI